MPVNMWAAFLVVICLFFLSIATARQKLVRGHLEVNDPRQCGNTNL